jgi:hypothetical protein
VWLRNGDRQRPHLAGTGIFERYRALFERRAGCPHIVNEHDELSLDES